MRTTKKERYKKPPASYGDSKKPYVMRKHKMNSPHTIEQQVSSEHLRQQIEDWLRRSGTITETEDVINVDLSNFIHLDESKPNTGTLKFTVNKVKE